MTGLIVTDASASTSIMPTLVSNPPNPWATTDVTYFDETRETRLEIFEDDTRSILSKNASPSVGFEFSVNPYRGCQHACAYCEARRRHELLGFGAGTDFDTKIVVKPRAAQLLRGAFEAPSWKGDVVVFSGATDCYQPLEASYRLTRACLEVCAEYRNPVAIVTKGALIERDLDVLRRLNEEARVTVSISIPIFDPVAARAIEPLVPSPQRRISIIRKLADAGIDVGISIAPMILGLGEEGMTAMLAAAKDAGARRAVLSFLRLPSPVDHVFVERLREVLPLRAAKIMARAKETIDVSSASLVRREKGSRHSSVVDALFALTCRRLGLAYSTAGDDHANTPNAGPMELRTFTRPTRPGRQLRLF